MSVRKEANCQMDPQLFTYSHVAFAPLTPPKKWGKQEGKRVLVHQTGVTNAVFMAPPPNNTLVVISYTLSLSCSCNGTF